jgi:AcrR family transcriptional regulator
MRTVPATVWPALRAAWAKARPSPVLTPEGGLPAATVDAIAERSGVSKTTIYNHWPSRTAIAASAFAELMGAAVPVPDTGSLAGDVTEHMVRLGAFYASEPRGKTFAQLLAAGVDDEAGRRISASTFSPNATE